MTRSRSIARAAGGGTLVAGLALAFTAAPAAAHVTNEPTEVAAGSFASVTLTVPHGCDEAPTSSLTIEVPEGVTNVSPQVHPGWQIAVETETLAEPIDTGEGEPITERTSVVTFTAAAGNELPGHYRDQFTIGYRAPDTPGEYLFFKTIQICAEGQTEWIEEYTGEGEEPEHPSPAVLLTEATGDGHGGGGEEEAATDDTTDATEVAAEPVAATDDDDDGVDPLSIIALAVGAAGLAFGVIAFSRTRSSS